MAEQDPTAMGTGEGTPPNPTVDPQTQPVEEGNKGDVNIALHQARQEAKRAKEEKEALEQRVKELELKGLPEDEQINKGFAELTKSTVLSKVDDAAFKALPEAIRSKLEKEPWAFVSEDAIKKETRFAESKSEYYNIVARLATESINGILNTSKAPEPTQQQSQPSDPVVLPGTTAVKEPGSYTEAELTVMAFKDPERFAEIARQLKSQQR